MMTDNATATNDDTIIAKTASSFASVSFVVTGFGPFLDAPKNPSTILVQQLKNYLLENDKQELAAHIGQTLVLETSAQDARNTIDEMAKKWSSTNTIFLHLGVNYKGTGFQLEQCAYNDASFRIPDQHGYQPKDTVILDHLDLAARCDTTLDLAAVAENQTAIHPAMETKLSTDPGRFVCNYLYCYSLNKLQTKSNTCMFLHVPPFDVIAKDAQLAYIADLMRILLDVNHQS